jgi:hypothetical protein
MDRLVSTRRQPHNGDFRLKLPSCVCYRFFLILTWASSLEMVFFGRRAEVIIFMALHFPRTELVFDLSKVPPGVAIAAPDAVTQPMPRLIPPLIVVPLLFRLHTEALWRQLDRTASAVVKLRFHKNRFSLGMSIDFDRPAPQMIISMIKVLSSNGEQGNHEAPSNE